MKKFFIIIVAGFLIIAGSITLSNYIESRNKYRETTPQERAEFDSTRQAFIDNHRTVQARVTADSVQMVK